MKEVNITTNIEVYDNIEELPKEAKDLMLKAIDAKKIAYAPYSKFRVGAAILLENGMVVTGNNQENAAYPSGICAERVAVWKASSDYPDVKIKAIAISASSSSQTTKEPVAPCGGCRQTLLEYEQKQQSKVAVYFMGEVGKIIKTHSLVDLLPMAFDKTFL